jgi:hypothetical protein
MKKAANEKDPSRRMELRIAELESMIHKLAEGIEARGVTPRANLLDRAARLLNFVPMLRDDLTALRLERIE